MFQLSSSFAMPRTVCSFRVGQIPMPPALLAGPWGLCVPSSKPLEVEWGQYPAGLSDSQSVQPETTRWDRKGAGGRRPGFKFCWDCLARLPLALFSRLQNVYKVHIRPYLQWHTVK